MHIILFGLAIYLFPIVAAAQFKCQDQTGRVTFQQTACPASGTEEKIRLYENKPDPIRNIQAQVRINELARQKTIREAIATGTPMVGMTRRELDQAMGDPDKINAAQYGSSLQDQIIYYRNGRTLYVYTKDSVVTSIQNNEGMPNQIVAQRKQCPTKSDINDIEIEINKIANRENQTLQTELYKRLLDAKACR